MLKVIKKFEKKTKESRCNPSPSGHNIRGMGLGVEMDSQIHCKFVDLSSIRWQLYQLT